MDVIFSLLAGLAIAAAVQLMLTNLGIAAGLTVLNWAPKNNRSTDPDAANTAADDPSAANTLPVTHLLGFGVTVTLCLVLFVASLLMVEFSQIAAPRRGSIFGIILWAVYWLLFVWLSSTTLTGIANSVLGTAIAAGRRLLTTLQQAFGLPSGNAATLDQPLLRDLVAEVSQLTELQQALPALLAQQRDQLIAEISDRTDLSPTEAESVVDELGTAETPASNFSRSATSAGLLAQLDLPNWQQIVRQVLNRVDLSELDAETLWQQVKTLIDTADESAADEPEPIEAAILVDAEEFVLNAPTWSFHPETLPETFYERLYDPEAAPEQIRTQLSQLERTHLVDWLKARGDLAGERIEAIADQLDEVRDTVMAAVASSPAIAELQPALADVQEKLLAYCRYTNLDVLTPSSLIEKVQSVREAAGLPAQLSPEHRAQVDLAALKEVLSRRQGITEEQRQALEEALQTTWGVEEPSATPDPDLQERLSQALQRSLQAVDWATVSLEDLKPELLNQLQSLDLRGEPDWAALEQYVQVPTEVKTELIDWLQTTSRKLSRAPRRWAKRASRSTQSFAQSLSQQIVHYLKFQDRQAFHPEQIATDVAHLLKNAVQVLPSPSDWPDLSDLSPTLDFSAFQASLEKRRDMTSEEIQNVLRWLKSAWQKATQPLVALPQAVWSEARDWVGTEIDHLDAVRQRVVEQIADTQQGIQAQAAAVQADLQRQADAARRQVAIAAWWLFLSLLLSGGSAAIAGWLAASY